MDLALFGRYFLDFALLYPSAFLCLASLWEKLRTPRRTACIKMRSYSSQSQQVQ